jgi:hypothetical protein
MTGCPAFGVTAQDGSAGRPRQSAEAEGHGGHERQGRAAVLVRAPREGPAVADGLVAVLLPALDGLVGEGLAPLADLTEPGAPLLDKVLAAMMQVAHRVSRFPVGVLRRSGRLIVGAVELVAGPTANRSRRGLGSAPQMAKAAFEMISVHPRPSDPAHAA